MQTREQDSVRIARSENGVQIILNGNVTELNIEQPLADLQSELEQNGGQVSFNADNLKEWDSSLILLAYEAKALCLQKGNEFDDKNLPQNLQDLIALAYAVDRKPTKAGVDKLSLVERVGKSTIDMTKITSNVLDFIGSVFGGVARFFTFRSIMRSTDFWAAMEDCGPKAFGIVCLISFLVGLILAFVGAVQLETFGAQIYVASLVTIGMCRIMGAIMVGIIMAGRTGSSYAATIGTMQVNEELDALQTMGLSRIDFLVLPRLFSLLVAMPILTMVADFMGMLGGAFVGVFLMNLPYQEYWKYALDAFSLKNFLVGVFHGFCFGIIIALCGCYSGLTCGRNADSVGKATTQSVVCAVVWMIVVTGIITVICQELKI